MDQDRRRLVQRLRASGRAAAGAGHGRQSHRSPEDGVAMHAVDPRDVGASLRSCRSRGDQPPPFLLAAGLLFWGWFSGFMAAAVGMALALESPRFFRLRWELSRRDFERIADLCSIGFASALVFQFVQSRHFPDSLLSVLIWLPMLFFALLLAQRYSTLAAGSAVRAVLVAAPASGARRPPAGPEPARSTTRISA